MRHVMSAENFEEIFSYEIRKGSNLENRFFKHTVIPRLSKTIQRLKRAIKTNDKNKIRHFHNLYGNGTIKRKGLIARKKELLFDEFKKIESSINNGNYKINILSSNVNGKWIFSSVHEDACAFFVMKQLQRTIKQNYEIEMCDRNQIIRQLKIALPCQTANYVLRADIESFFESIPHQVILNKLKNDNQLPNRFLAILEDIFNIYRAVTNSNTGIPRGLGISSYLAELYLIDFDKNIICDEDVVFYGRYVDDFIVISNSKKENTKSIRNEINQKVKNLGLKLNTQKTKSLIWSNSDKVSEKFVFLGYQFELIKSITTTKKLLSISISPNKFIRYKKRIDCAISSYHHERFVNQKKALRMLGQRVRFLTSNFRLQNNKSNVYAGIYFSNLEITDTNWLTELDTYLQKGLSKAKISNLSKSGLIKYNFTEGYSTKRFVTYQPIKMEKIISAWRNHV